MQRILAWLLAGLLLAAAVWVVRSTQHESDGISQRTGQPPPEHAREAMPPEASAAVSAERAALRSPPEVASAPRAAEDSAAPAAQPGTDPQRDPREALRTLLDATRGASGHAAPADGSDGADAADGLAARGDAADADVEPELEEAAARLAEGLDIYTPEELEARIQREMARSGSDYDKARQKVLADGLAWDELASDALGPDATPQERRRYLDGAKSLGPLLDGTRKQELWRRRLGS